MDNMEKKSEEKFKIFKISAKTDPKQLATSIIYAVSAGEVIKAISIGESIKVLSKALAMVNLFSGENGTKYDFQPNLEYMPDNDGNIKNALTWTIKLK